jgi:hypothetical protein
MNRCWSSQDREQLGTLFHNLSLCESDFCARNAVPIFGLVGEIISANQIQISGAA